MKTFFTKLFTLIIFSFLGLQNTFCQSISVSYERDIKEIRFFNAIKYTNSGFALYYGIENSGSKNYVKLRNNNTQIWQTEINSSPDFHKPNNFFENESGFYYVGEGGLSTTASFGRINKISGNIEVKKTFTNNQFTRGFAISSTFGNNIILGGYYCQNSCTATIKVVNPLGEILQSKSSNDKGGVWGSNIYQIEKTKDNGYLLFGYIHENTNCGEISNKSLWICKLNSDLNVIWSKKYGNGNGSIDNPVPSDYNGPLAIINEKNDIIMLGRTYCTDGNGGGPNNFGEGTWLLKLDATGNILKYKSIGINLLDYTVSYTGISNSCNNSFVLSGTSGGTLGISYFIERFDFNLETKDIIYTSSTQTQTSYNYVRIEKGQDNSYIMSGRKGSDNFIAKTTPDPACGTNPPLLLCDNTIGQYSICEDFDKLQNGNILPQGSPKFSLFSGSADENATVNTEKAFSGSKSLKFTNTSDIDFNIDRTIQSPTRMEWMTYTDAGKTGSWGLETSTPTVYSLVTRLNNGQGTVYTISSSNQLETRGTFTYTPGQWYKTALIFNNTENTIEVWVNNKMIYSRPGHTSRLITDLNLYGTSSSTNNLFYVDNLLYYETNLNCNCTNEYAPVCVNGKEFSNACRARCAGYTESEWTQGPCGGGGSTSLVFDIDDNICGPVGQIVTIPVKVKGFSKISSFQFSINIPDNTKGEITGIEKGNIAGDLNFGLISPSTATVVWDNTAAVDLTDNTVVINLKVRIKTLFTGSTDINIVGTPTEISADQNNQTIKPSVVKGSFCATASSYKICGKITREDNVAIPNVTVTLSGGKNATATTNANGEYCFENLDGNLNYTVKPSKNTNHGNGINGGDVTAIRKHILATEKLNSPYKIIAADAVKNNTVNGGDVTEIRKLILAVINQFTTTESWTFVPKAHVFGNPENPFSTSIPNTITVNNLNNNISDQNFIGIKIGDVTLNNTPANVHDVLENRNMADINLIVGSANVVGNQNFDIDITVRQFKEITTGQFSINWNTSFANFISLKNLNTTLGLTNDNFNALQTSSGKLGFLWDSPTPVNLTDNTRLFTLSFKAKSNGTSNISVTDNPVSKYFENKNKESLNIVVTTGALTVPTEDDLIESKINIYPNPSSGFLTIESDYKNIKNLEVRSLDGRLVHLISSLQDDKIDLSFLAPNSYMIKGFVNDYPFTKKIVIIR